MDDLIVENTDTTVESTPPAPSTDPVATNGAIEDSKNIEVLVESTPPASSVNSVVPDTDQSLQNGTTEPVEDKTEIESDVRNESCDSNKENKNDEENYRELETFTEEETRVFETVVSPGLHGDTSLMRNHCTACNIHLGTAPANYKQWKVHPCLKVVICTKCFEFYASGEFQKDEDGSEMYCRWCGQGGKVLCCSTCEFVFCQRCIRANFSHRMLLKIIKSDDWRCFVCDPTQLSILRTQFKALYQFALKQNELKASTINQDLSVCCLHKQKPAPKKRKAGSPDLTYDPSMEETAKKKKKPAVEDNWNKAESDEVVCTPDVTMLMMDDEESPESLPPPPPLTSFAFKPGSFAVNTDYVLIPNGDGFRMAPAVPLLNNSNPPPLVLAPTVQLNPPIVLSNLITPTNGSKVTKTFLSPSSGQEGQQLIVGQKYEWFDKAEQLITTISGNLNTTLTSLNFDQKRAKSVKDLAEVHNNLQKILSSSINALTQVRRNLRNNFLNGLKGARFESCKISNEEIIDVDASVFPTSSKLKVKSVNAINTSPNNIIDISDDAIQTVEEKETPTETNETKDDKKEELTVDTNLPNTEENVDEFSAMALSPNTRICIKNALIDSKLDQILAENMNMAFEDYSPEMLKRMMSVRVLVEENYGKRNVNDLANPKYIPMKIRPPSPIIEDFEEMLSSSIVSKVPVPQKENQENDQTNTNELDTQMISAEC